MTKLLSRYAEATFWMARYVERVENLARILDVNETFSRDSRGGQNWQSILQLNADEERFLESYDEITADSVIQFYLLDQNNPTSIIRTIRMARENARTLRALISTEMWIQLNMFYTRLRNLTPADASEPKVDRLCTMIKESCQTHTGITEGTFYRDEGWYFYQLGRKIERADQTTRLLDVKYHLLLPSPERVGSPQDVSQWNALLRSASAYHAFRRIHPRGMSPETVAGFLLFDRAFPRSVMACVASVERTITDLRARHNLAGGLTVLEQLDGLRRALEDQTIESIIEIGLHEFLDNIQLALIATSHRLGLEFFGHEPDGETALKLDPAEALAEA